MKSHHRTSGSAAEGCLQGVIEPLASYICAADQPRAALLAALRTLVSEVRMTQRAAAAYVGGQDDRR